MSDTDHPNVALIQQGAGYFQAGDLPGFLSLMSDDPPVVYRVPGNNPISGVYVGKEAVTAFFMQLGEMTNFSLKVTPYDIIADDRHAFMMWTGSVDRGERHLDAKGAMAFKITPDGKFAEAWFLYGDQVAYNEFYS